MAGENMSLDHSICIYSEIGKLKSVLLHCPGEEVENIVPPYLKRLLLKTREPTKLSCLFL